MTLRIVLNNGRTTFFPGMTVEGKIVLDTSESLKYRSIFILFQGDGFATWKVGKTRFRSTYQCFSLKTTLLNGPLEGQTIPAQQGNSFVLAPNTYEFPFSFRVPVGAIPSSYEDRPGIFDDREAYIRYWLDAMVDRPWRLDLSIRRPVQIRELVELNGGRFNRPHRGSIEKTICCLCCSSAPMMVDACINRSGYYCREEIILSVRVNNTSSRTLNGIQAKLMREVLYSCREDTCERIDCLVQKQSDTEIGPGLHFDWNDVSIPVPQDLLPTSSSCPIIVTKYYVLVEVITPSFSLNASIRLPVTIGNVQIQASRGPEVGVDVSRLPEILEEDPTVSDTAPLLP